MGKSGSVVIVCAGERMVVCVSVRVYMIARVFVSVFVLIHERERERVCERL